MVVPYDLFYTDSNLNLKNSSIDNSIVLSVLPLNITSSIWVIFDNKNLQLKIVAPLIGI